MSESGNHLSASESEQKQASSTKEQVLSCAVPLFAEKGYRDVTCAEVSRAAEANIAAINYHFGSKENLYRLSMRRAFELANKKYPFNAGIDKDSTPEAQLLAMMSAMIRRNFDDGPAGYLNRIMAHQVSRPTAPHALVIEEISNLQGNHLSEIIRKITGELSEPFLQQAKMNVVALCVFPRWAPAMKQHLFPAPPSEEDLTLWAEHQHRFALAGLQSLKMTDPS
ncbi:CerR family C-terminal domain-containing protein [Verrucomicrobiaceae bacterium N1E253]|uniref:CerR family C-terminal domain-containing protein n=1 Tax=Oceaniferula marina TaxID=2748318 RepID=A0A851GAA4_9BACT|nr:TetR family transcriptional regulator [Oceaniferula marina]NWK54336.1 CerR family C-terminal domain-containing protein [Oceaniferula marina]